MAEMMIAKRRTAEVLEFRDGRGDHAVFTIDEQPERHYFALSIESSFGGYSYAWSSPGASFREFLCRISFDYLIGKMVGHDEVFDGEETTREVKKAIIALRKDGCSADEARDAWPESDFDTESDFERWCADTELFRGREPWFLQRSCPGRRSREFTALYERFWPALREAIEPKKAAAANG
jgi:hypothetical protein